MDHKNEVTSKGNVKRKSLFKTCILCCNTVVTDNEVNSDEEDMKNARDIASNLTVIKTEPDDDSLVDYPYQKNGDDLKKTELVNVGLSDRRKLARWKAETRVSEWRTAALAYRDGKIAQIDKKGLIENDAKLTRKNVNHNRLLWDGAKGSAAAANRPLAGELVNSKHSIKFKQGNIENADFFEIMELPECRKSGKTLLWNVLVQK